MARLDGFAVGCDGKADQKRSRGRAYPPWAYPPPVDENAVRATIQQKGIEWVRQEAVDLDGVVRGKRTRSGRFLGDLSGSPITDIHFAMSIGEDYYENTWGPWREGILGDMLIVPDLATFRAVPWEDRVASVMCDWGALGGGPVAAAPRTVLADQVGLLDALGLSARVAIEYEFFLAHADRSPVFRGKRTNDMLRSSEQHVLLGPVIDAAIAYGIPVEEVKVESAGSQVEVNVEPALAIEACDRAARLKLTLKELLLKQGIVASFMARPPEVEFGSSSHVHVSLWSGDAPAFFDAGAHDRMSASMRHAIGGLLATMKPLLPVFCPTTNSGRRLIDFSAAPTAVCWGYENKSVAVRTVTRTPGAARVEHRLAGADANPYLVVAAILAGIRHGIEAEVEPPPPKTFFAWQPIDKELDLLPRALDEATDLMEKSDVVPTLFDPVFVDHFVASRRWEVAKQQECDKELEEWELDRYFVRV